MLQNFELFITTVFLKKTLTQTKTQQKKKKTKLHSFFLKYWFWKRYFAAVWDIVNWKYYGRRKGGGARKIP